MQDQPLERLEVMFLELLDKRLKPINARLKKLETAYKAIAIEQREGSLDMGRRLGNFIVISTMNSLASINAPVDAVNKLNMSASAVIAKLPSSDDPVNLAYEFYESCMGTLKKAGIKTASVD